MPIEPIREHNPGYSTTLIEKQNLCLSLVVLLVIDDLVSKIGNVFAELA